jgi:hypothetical protein
MSLQQNIESFKKRIAEAEANREAWRLVGNREKYLEAYFAVEAMELILDAHLRERATHADALMRSTSVADIEISR